MIKLIGGLVVGCAGLLGCVWCDMWVVCGVWCVGVAVAPHSTCCWLVD